MSLPIILIVKILEDLICLFKYNRKNGYIFGYKFLKIVSLVSKHWKQNVVPKIEGTIGDIEYEFGDMDVLTYTQRKRKNTELEEQKKKQYYDRVLLHLRHITLYHFGLAQPSEFFGLVNLKSIEIVFLNNLPTSVLGSMWSPMIESLSVVSHIHNSKENSLLNAFIQQMVRFTTVKRLTLIRMGIEEIAALTRSLENLETLVFHDLTLEERHFKTFLNSPPPLLKTLDLGVGVNVFWDLFVNDIPSTVQSLQLRGGKMKLETLIDFLNNTCPRQLQFLKLAMHMITSDESGPSLEEISITNKSLEILKMNKIQNLSVNLFSKWTEVSNLRLLKSNQLLPSSMYISQYHPHLESLIIQNCSNSFQQISEYLEANRTSFTRLKLSGERKPIAIDQLVSCLSRNRFLKSISLVNQSPDLRSFFDLIELNHPTLESILVSHLSKEFNLSHLTKSIEANTQLRELVIVSSDSRESFEEYLNQMIKIISKNQFTRLSVVNPPLSQMDLISETLLQTLDHSLKNNPLVHFKEFTHRKLNKILKKYYIQP